MNGTVSSLPHTFLRRTKKHSEVKHRRSYLPQLLLLLSFLYSGLGFSQMITPGGIDTTKLSIWLKADQGITGSNVSNWSDQGIYSFDATASGGHRPSFEANTNNFNPSIYFDSSQYMLIPTGLDDSLMMHLDSFSIYSIAYSEPGVSAMRTLYSDSRCFDTSGYSLQFDGANTEWNFFGAEGGDGTSFTNSATTSSNNTATPYSLIKFRRNGANHLIETNAGGLNNNNSGTVLDFSSDAPHLTERYIGQKYTCSGTDPFKGNVSEFIIVRDNVSTQDDRKIQSYLGLKYGLTLNPSLGSYTSSVDSVLWDDFMYWNEVAGIVQDDSSQLDQRISKSQDSTGIITIATTSDYTSANVAGTRTSLGDGNAIVWGNNGTSASTPWSTTGAPDEYAMLGEVWKVQETGTVDSIYLQIDLEDLQNNVPDFEGNLFFVHGADLSMATPMPMTDAGGDLWTIKVDFSDGDLFSFVVENRITVEFSDTTASSTDESLADNFPSIIIDGLVNAPISFSITATGVSATVGFDYTYTTEVMSLPLGTYTAGVTDSTLIPPSLNNDPLLEADEDISFSIIPNLGVTVGDADVSGDTAAVHIYTITDDDDASLILSINSAMTNVTEGPSVDITYTVSMDGGVINLTGDTITGSLNLTGTATNGIDYTNVTEFFILPDSNSTIVTVPVTNDTDIEGDETVIATILDPSLGDTSAINNGVSVTIIDDDAAAMLISISNPIDATEGGTLYYDISIDGGAVNTTGSDITVFVNFAGSSAQENIDFPASVPFVIPDGQSSATIGMSADTDNIAESIETVIVNLTSASIGNINGLANSAEAEIIDLNSTSLTYTLTASTATINEFGGSFTYTVSIDGPTLNQTGSGITGTLNLSGNASPLNNAPFNDHNFNTITPFTIPNGASDVAITITVINDALIEGTETISAIVSGLSIPGAISNNNLSVDIIDDDLNNLSLSAGSPTDGFEGPSGFNATFVVSIDGGAINNTGSIISGTITYDYSCGGGGGVLCASLSDFNATPSFFIQPGDNSDTVQIQINDDPALEGYEFIYAAISNPTINGNSIGIVTNGSVTMQIDDNEDNNLKVTPSAFGESEGGNDAMIIATLVGGVSNSSGTTIVGEFTVTGVNATANPTTDFLNASTTINFSIGNNQTADTFYIEINDDDILENPETFAVEITSLNLGDTINGVTNFIIGDNEMSTLVLSIGSPSNTTEGPNSSVSYDISMNGQQNGLGDTLFGNVSLTGTAQPGIDYTNTSSFYILDGNTFGTLTVPIINDDFIEQTESVIATISSPIYTVDPSLTQSTAFIADDDLGNASVSIVKTLDGTESVEDAEFTVSLDGGMQNQLGTPLDFTIDLGGTATGGNVDYSNSTTTNYSISNNSGSTAFDIFIIDDPSEEPTETIVATITYMSDGIAISNNQAIADLFDDDTDSDNDGLHDIYDPNDVNIDTDGDGIMDGCDYEPSPGVFNGVDSDGDGIKDACDTDITGGPDGNDDGIDDNVWPWDDVDGDYLPDSVDPDTTTIDTDGDLIPDGADVDIDGDGINDNGIDSDGDGINDIADADDSPQDDIIDDGNQDSDGDDVDNDWDPTDQNIDVTEINHIVTPNGDNINETLKFKGLSFFSRHELTIFNRWGTPIYHSTEYGNDWKGQINTNQNLTLGVDLVSEGTYFYTLKLEVDETKKVGTIRGYIELRK